MKFQLTFTLRRNEPRLRFLYKLRNNTTYTVSKKYEENEVTTRTMGVHFKKTREIVHGQRTHFCKNIKFLSHKFDHISFY